MNRREFVKSLAALAGSACLVPALGCGTFSLSQRPSSRSEKRPIYWWAGGGLHMLDDRLTARLRGIAVAYKEAFDPKIEAKRGFRLVSDYGDMDKDDSTNDVEHTIANLKAHYRLGARRISTDLEWGRFDRAETLQFIHAIENMPDLEVLQWNGWWNWDQPERDLLEQCEQLVLAEMVYPLVSNEDLSYKEIYKTIEHGMSRYRLMPEARHAIALSAVCHSDNMQIKEPDHPIAWGNMKRQVDAAIDYGTVIGHPNQALAFYYPVPVDYALKVIRYIDGEE